LLHREHPFLTRKYNLDYVLQEAVSIPDPDRRGLVHWEEYSTTPIQQDHLERDPFPQSRYLPLEAPLSDGKLLTTMQKDFLDWVFRQAKVAVRANEALEVYAGPEISQAEFRTQLSQAAHERLDAEKRKINDKYEKQIEALQEKNYRERCELSGDQTELAQRRAEMGTHAENILSLFSKRLHASSSSLTKRRL
jgi:hypothetical protein